MTASTSHLIPPHGAELVNLIATAERAAELKSRSREQPSWEYTPRELCDLELLMSGRFSPLRGFMTRADYEGLCHNMRLANGTLWPMPITEDFASTLEAGSKVALRDPEGVMLAVHEPEACRQCHSVDISTRLSPSPADYAVVCGGPADFVWIRRFDIASHRGAAPAAGVVRSVRDQVAREAVWVESGSRGFLGHFVEKSLPLLAWQEFE